jgi:hypothetical protein
VDQLLQLVFGYRDLDTLVAEHYDCGVADATTAAVLRSCFPAGPSDVWALA